MQLFYNAELTESSVKFTFPTEESKHIIKVLRKKEGDILAITNGSGYVFEAKISHEDLRKCTVEIIKCSYYPQEGPHLHLAVAPTKMNDRYEWFLEKATEIGISEITPIICDHSERKIIKLDRMQKVVQSAMKQSLHCHLPKLNEPISFAAFMTSPFSTQVYIAHCEETKKTALKERLRPNEDALVLIGPEGDFSLSEINTALEKGFEPVTFGPNRLRTETAALYATTCFSICNS